MPAIKRGEIRLANLNPGKGTEPGKVRPVLIFQEQALLDADHPSTIVIPLTTNTVKNAEPLRIRVKKQGKLSRESDLLIDQIRVIDNRRLQGAVFARLNQGLMDKVATAMLEVLGLGGQLAFQPARGADKR